MDADDGESAEVVPTPQAGRAPSPYLAREEMYHETRRDHAFER